MHKITLVCSAHRENGFCNAEELLKILRAIEPEAVFEEIRSSDFDSYYKHRTIQTLETQTITKYAEFGSFRQVPVDRYEMPTNLDVETQRVFARVEQASQEYRELKQVENDNVYQYGFRYLNSAVCEKLTGRLSEIEEKIVIGTGDQALIRGLEKWRHIIQRRELEMVGNIYEYCRKNAFDTGVFLVGAAHKTGIVKAIEKYACAEADLINWSFAYDGPNPLGAT